MTPEEAKLAYDALIEESRMMNLQKTKEVYTEVHHVLPRCMGGTNNKENLVRMLARKHFEAHLYLVKMFPEMSYNWHKMIKALHKMSFGLHKNEYKIMADEYEQIRKLNSQPISSEHKENISKGVKIAHTPEVRERIRKSLTGQKRSAESIQNYHKAASKPEAREARKRRAAGKNNPRARKVDKYDPKTHQLIDQFDTINDAAKSVNVPRDYIRWCCQGRYQETGGFVWKFHSE